MPMSDLGLRRDIRFKCWTLLALVVLLLYLNPVDHREYRIALVS